MRTLSFEEIKREMRNENLDELEKNLDYINNKAVTFVAKKIEFRIKYQYIDAEAKPEKGFRAKGFFFIAPKKLKGSEVTFLKRYIYSKWAMELYVFSGGRICYLKNSEAGWRTLLCDDED